MDIKQTEVFTKWVADIRDPQAKAAVVSRIRRASLGTLGLVKTEGEAICAQPRR